MNYREAETSSVVRQILSRPMLRFCSNDLLLRKVMINNYQKLVWHHAYYALIGFYWQTLALKRSVLLVQRPGLMNIVHKHCVSTEIRELSLKILEVEMMGMPIPQTLHLIERIGGKKSIQFTDKDFIIDKLWHIIIDIIWWIKSIFHRKNSREYDAVLIKIPCSYSIRTWSQVDDWKSAPSCCQWLCRLMLAEWKYVTCKIYIDDFMLFDETEEEELIYILHILV